MIESFTNSKFEYIKLTPEEQSKRGILGRLAGVIADGKNPTRNGRKYPFPLREKVFSDPLTEEKIKNKVCMGELGHPSDRLETDMEKVCISLAEMPKKGNDGKLYGVFDILDTPNGRILKTLCDYGANIGVSSRGDGEVYEDYDNSEVVDENTYQFEAFDAVLLPAVKDARPQYVTESLHSQKPLKQILTEAINKETAEGKKIITETLDNLGVEYKDSLDSNDKETVEEVAEEAVNDGNEVMTQLQEALKDNAALSKQITSLQSRLSVSNAKEVKLRESVDKLKGTVLRLSDNAKTMAALKTQIRTLREQLESKLSQYNDLKTALHSKTEKLNRAIRSQKSLLESVDTKSVELSKMDSAVNSLNEKLIAEKQKFDTKINSLNEELNQLKVDSEVKNSQYEKKLRKANALVEQYRKSAQSAVNKYIECKATQLGVSPKDISAKLQEKSSFKEVDTICEGLMRYNQNMSKLPFGFTSNNISGVAMKENRQSKRFENPDDVIDENLLESFR